jgi:hypothetical protein
MKEEKETQLSFLPEEDKVEITKVEYENLDHVDLVRLCKEKDSAIESYETERKNNQEVFNKEFENMNKYYSTRINELKALISYYERKFNLLKTIIDIEKGEEKHDTI